VLLTAWWTALAWRDLGALRLPEAADMLRLAQIRDWVDGQGFADLTQARLGPPGGTPMAETRLADIVPAVVIRLLSPLMGPKRAEIAAVIFWPELLFFLHLLLSGALARRLGGAAVAAPAVALAALAFPAIAVLMPGRLAHQGLQLVLVEGMALGLLEARLLPAGVAAGLALLAGPEAALPMLGAMAWLAVSWAQTPRAVAGFGAGLLGAALVGVALLRPELWPTGRCDGFTPPLFAAMLVCGGYWLVLAGLAPRLPDARWRGGAAALLAAFACAAIWFAAPSCFSGWAEASKQVRWTAFVAWLGLPFVALAAGLWLMRRGEQPGTALLVAMIGTALAAAFGRLELALFAAAMAPPVLALWTARIRARHWGLQTGVWLVSAGLVWQTIGRLAEPRPDPRAASCISRETLAALDRLETGTFAAPAELGAYLVGGTQHRSLAGGGGRNARGNGAVADLFRATPDEARVQANLWTVDYVALCADETGGLPPALLRPGGLAAHLLNGAAPDWLEPVTLLGSDLPVWRVRAVAGPGLRP
jgi:hypothetical protein